MRAGLRAGRRQDPNRQLSQPLSRRKYDPFPVTTLDLEGSFRVSSGGAAGLLTTGTSWYGLVPFAVVSFVAACASTAGGDAGRYIRRETVVVETALAGAGRSRPRQATAQVPTSCQEVEK